MFLIDTMVLSELRRRQRDPGVVAWIRGQRQEDCFFSPPPPSSTASRW